MCGIAWCAITWEAFATLATGVLAVGAAGFVGWRQEAGLHRWLYEQFLDLPDLFGGALRLGG